MATVIYPAVATGDKTAGYTATFPDLSGVTAFGYDLGDLLAKAREALRAHLTQMSHAGRDWPEATPIEQVAAPSGPTSAGVLLVDVQIEETPVRVNISIGERLLRRIDEAAERRGMTRSGFIASAARTALGDGPQATTWNHSDWEAASNRLQEEFAVMGRKLSDSLGPESAFAQNMAELDEKLTDTIRKTADSVASALRRRQVERQTAAGSSSTASQSQARSGPTPPDEPAQPAA